MLLRMWWTEFDLDRLDELNEFARTRSTPMFEAFTGCLGHVFAHQGDRFLAASTWIGHHAIGVAEASSLYRETVDSLAATGLLRGEQSGEVFDISSLNMGE